jgi:hypothetical protein
LLRFIYNTIVKKAAPKPSRRWPGLVLVFLFPMAALTAFSIHMTRLYEFLGWGIASLPFFAWYHAVVLPKTARWSTWAANALLAWSISLFGAAGVGYWREDKLAEGLRDLNLPLTNAQALCVPAILLLTLSLALFLFVPKKSV